MRIIASILYITLICFVACKKQSSAEASSSTAADSTSVDSNKSSAVVTCYEEIAGQDTFRLRIERTGSAARGTLEYLFFEKDEATGDFFGQMKGDTLIADYAFMSEGVSSLRQIAFILFRDKAVEGNGPSKEENGMMVFENPGALTYGQGLNMQQVDCPVEE